MAINFAAASTAGLNNPGTEIITLVKDGSGNFINPPSYDKIQAYLRSGDVPCLFVTDESGETGSLYQLAEYSETENKIRFSNDTNAIEFRAGSVAPVVSDVGGGGADDVYVIKQVQNYDTQKVELQGDYAGALAAHESGNRLTFISTVVTGGKELVLFESFAYYYNDPDPEFYFVCYTSLNFVTYILTESGISSTGNDTHLNSLYVNAPDNLFLKSSTNNRLFRIKVSDTGVLSTEEVT